MKTNSFSIDNAEDIIIIDIEIKKPIIKIPNSIEKEVKKQLKNKHYKTKR